MATEPVLMLRKARALDKDFVYERPLLVPRCQLCDKKQQPHRLDNGLLNWRDNLV
jgi:hypothetical protein